MKEKLTIGQFAKLRNVTTETLRHYDRIGLLKPAFIDPQTGYRYYSILQEERLGTIRELRQLGVDIDTIQKFFTNRNLNQSLAILKEKHSALREKIQEMQLLEKHIGDKINYLESVTKIDDLNKIELKTLPERKVITYNKQSVNDVDLSYAFVQLEMSLNEISPILGSDRIGAVLNPSSSSPHSKIDSMNIFLFLKDNKTVDSELIKTIPSGDYLCSYCNDSLWNISEHYEKMINHITSSGYKVCGKIIQLIRVDIGMTDSPDELLYEIQFPIKKI